MAVKKRGRTEAQEVTRKAGDKTKAVQDFIKSASNVSVPAISSKAPRNFKSITLKFNEFEYRQFDEMTHNYDGGSLEFLRELLQKEYKSFKKNNKV